VPEWDQVDLKGGQRVRTLRMQDRKEKDLDAKREKSGTKWGTAKVTQIHKLLKSW
jgi:hypothetical protein